MLVLSICAVAARFSNNPAVQHMPRYQAGTEYAEEATRLVLANFDNPNMTILTSLLLLGLHEFGTCQGGRSWSFGGMATRMAYALSLHKDPEDVKLGGQEPPKDDNPPYFSFMNRELRRRVMWACFSMDRFNSSGTQRLGMIIESDIEIPLPMNDSDLDLGRAMVTERLDGTVKGQEANARNNMGVAAYMIRVIALFGRVSKYLNLGGKEKDPFPWTDHNSQFAKLNEQVLAFPQSLPERLRYSDINLQNHADNHLSSQFLFIHIAYHHVRLFLHQFALPSSPRDVQNPAPEYVRCAKIAVDAATQISCMISKAAENGYKLVAPFMGYCAFTSSNVHLVRAFSKEREVQEQAEQHLSVNMKYLGQMKNWWGLFTHIYDTIRGQSRMYSDAGMQSTPTQNLQYGDWFQKYPQGVAEIPGTTSIRQIVPPLAEQKRNRAMDTCLDYRLDLMTAEEYFAKYGSATREKPAPTGVAGKTAKTTSTTSASTSTPMPQSQSNPRTIPAPISLAQATPTNIHHLTRRPQPISIPTARDKDLDSKLDPQLLNPMPPPPAPPQQAQPQTPRALTSPTYASEYTIAPNSPHNVTQYQSSIQSIQAGSSSSHSQSMSPTSYQSYSTPLLSPHQDDGGLTAHHHQLSHTHVQHQQIPAPQYQMYDSYSTPTPTATPTSTTGNGGEQNVLWEYADLSQDNNHHAGAHLMNSFADQTSTAWFVPFNLDHPAGGVSSDAGVGMTAYGHQLLEDEIGLRVGGMHTGLEIVGVGPVPEGGMQIHGHLMQQHQHQHERSHLQRGHMHVQHQNQTHHNLHLQPAYPPDPRYGHHGHHQQ